MISEVSQLVFDKPLPRLLVSDLNRDGHPDLVLFGDGLAGVLAYLSNAKGELQAGVSIFEAVFNSNATFFSRPLGIVDVNRDGVCLRSWWFARQATRGKDWRIQPGRGDGGFANWN